MKNHILFLLILFSIQFSLSQNKKQDSILQVLKTHTKQDSLRVETLLDATYYYRTREFEKATPLIMEAINISKKKNYKSLEGRSYLYLSRNERRKGLNDVAIKNALVAVQIFENIQSNKNLMLANSHLAMLYQETGFPKKAIAMHLENIAISKNDPSSGAKARYYFDVGNAYKKLKEYQKAEKYYLNAVKIAKESNFIPGEMIMLSTLGRLYISTGQYAKAKQYINRALPYYEKTGQLSSIAGSYQNLANISSLENKHKASIPLYNKALDIYNQIGSLSQTRDINQKLFIAYNIVKDYDKAKVANKIYNTLKDSISSTARKKMIVDMKTKYETDKISVQKEIAENKALLAQAQSKQNKRFFIGAAIIAGLILLSSLFFFGRLRERKKAELVTIELRETQKRLALEKQYKDSELKALKAQMNPHFIFNALNSIQEYILLNKKNLASDYLGKFADLIRNYLHYSDTGLISITEEAKNLNLYLELEKLRFEDDLSYTIIVDSTLNSDILYIPTMIVQPYIENALKHGLLHKKTDRKLKIIITKVSNQLIECVVEDNGIGREKSKEINKRNSVNHKSFALKATSERLELLNFGKDKKIGVEIEDIVNEYNEITGTKVVLNIPVTKNI